MADDELIDDEMDVEDDDLIDGDDLDDEELDEDLDDDEVPDEELVASVGDEDDEDEEEEAPPASAKGHDRTDGGDRVAPRAAEEFPCNECFLLVRRSQFSAKRTDCPGGLDGEDCPVKRQLGLV